MEILRDGDRHSISLVFKCRIEKNQKPKVLEQSRALKFFNKIPSKNIVSFHKNFLIKNMKTIQRKG